MGDLNLRYYLSFLLKWLWLLVLGTVLAAGIAFLIEYLDDRLKGPEQVSAVLGVVTLGTIALVPPGRREKARNSLLTITDPRSPTAESFRVLRTMWGTSASTGLTNALLSQDDPGAGQFMQATEVENLRLLTTGSLAPNPAEMAGSRRMGEVVDRLAQQAKVIILDSPLVLAATGAAVLSRHVQSDWR